MSRPKSVKIALTLAALTLAVGIVNTYGHWQRSVEQFGLPRTLFVAAVPTLLYVGLLLLVAYRNNWARWVLIILIVIAIPGYILSLSQPLPALSKAVQALQLVLNAACAVLLLTPESRNWFKR